MADPLSLTASIIGVLQATGVIISYIKDVRDAPQDRDEFLVEISTLEFLLRPLERRVREIGFGDPWLTAFEALGVKDGPLDQLKSDLHRLESKLEPANRIKELGRRLAWRFTKTDIKEILAKIERIKTLATFVLENDLFALSRAIKEESSDIKATITRIEGKQKEEKRQKIAGWLTRLDFTKSHSEAFQMAVDGTGQWLLQSNEFMDWRDGTSGTLWCRGIPGGGKTVLTSIVINHLQIIFQNRNIAIAYIYFNYNKHSEQTVPNLVATLLKQMLASSRATFNRVESLYDRREPFEPMLHELMAVLKSVIGEYSKVFIILDALDECLEDTLVEFFRELGSLSSTVNLMVTSRDMPSIERILPVTQRLEIRAHDGDVKSYIESRIARSHRRHLTVLRASIISKIVGNIGGMFLLARLHLDSLSGKHSTAAAREALENLPKEVDHTYDEAMERIMRQTEDDSKLAKQILSWITYACRPLSVTELQHALATRPGMTSMDPEYIVDEEILTSVCAGLVTIDEEHHIIHFVHHTTKEYFERKRDTLFSSTLIEITTRCLAYLSFEEFERGGFSRSDYFDEEVKSLLRENPFLDYAAQYWGIHAQGLVDAKCGSMTLDLLSTQSRIDCISGVMLAHPEHRFRQKHSRRVVEDFSALHMSAFFGLQETLKSQLVKSDTADLMDSSNRTPLSWAAERGHEQIVRILVARDDVNVDSKDDDGQTPLWWAARYGRHEIVRLFLARDDVNADWKDHDGLTPLWWATWYGCEEVVKLLVARKDVDVNLRDEYGMAPLSWAVANGHQGVVKALLTRDDIDANTKDGAKRTPLALASLYGKGGVMRLLLAHGDVDANSKDKAGQTPLSLAAEGGSETAVKLLLARDDVDADLKAEDGRTPLSRAAANGHKDVVQLLVAREDVDADSKDTEDRTPLSWAAAGAHEEVVKLLVARNDVDANLMDSNGRILLSLAAEGGSGAILRLLMERDDVDPDSKDHEGRTPLSWAAANGHEEVIKLLVARETVDADSKDNGGRTPLSWAAANGRELWEAANRREAVVQLLVERDDVDADSNDNSGRTPLSWAAESGNEDVVQLLVLRDDVFSDSKDVVGRTPLSWAATGGGREWWGAARVNQQKVMKVLLGRDDVNVNSKDAHGRTPLSWAAGCWLREVVELLLARDDVDADSRDHKGRTPLSWAAANGRWEILWPLVMRTDVNADSKDIAGRTPLSWAAECGNDTVVETLIAREDVDLHSRDNDNLTPLAWATRNEHTRVVYALENAARRRG